MQIPTATWNVLSSAVDWYSATTDDPEIGRWAYERARDYIEADRLGETDGMGKSVLGYFGVASEQTFVGEREGSTFVSLSADAARDRWFEFNERGLRPSRIDLCVTARADRDVRDLAKAIRFGGRLPTRVRGKRAELSLITPETAGDTLYVGTVGSDRRGRLYDKSRESNGAYPVGTWRWEVQSRHKYAQDVGVSLGRRIDVTPWIQTYVKGWFEERGVMASFPDPQPSQRDTYHRERTTDEKRLDYLKKSIAPMVRRLKARYSVHELRAVLGLLYDPGETRPR